MTFANKEALWLLLVIPVLVVWYNFKIRKNSTSLNFSSLANFDGLKPSLRQYLQPLLVVFRMLAIAMLIIVLARPQSRSSWKNVTSEGIDIILAMDISASMLAQDFKPNRLEASKEVAIEFIDNRPTDKIGLVIFSGESFTQCPLTTDHAVIKNLFFSVKTGMIADGTAIGLGLANAVNRIKDSKAKSKVVILLTDGVNNVGAVAPMTAAEIAKAFGVRVYTIGVGSMGKALSPVAIYPNGQYQFDYVDVKIDDDGLSKIAQMTGGKYFRATDKKKLKQVYAEIDKMEKTIIEEKSFTNKEERFLIFAIAAALFFALELFLKYTLLKILP
ncbi:MAG: VWA domain-containing protein [Bacteroidetes bacterium]|nr:VWA domain-containing protein [Bacteroidota bacterium]